MSDSKINASSRYRVLLCLLCLWLSVWLTGCATTTPSPGNNKPPAQTENTSKETAADYHVVEYESYQDPLIGWNRWVFAFNDKAYRYLLFPIGKGYHLIVPQPVDNSLSNFFYNIKSPIYILNHALQAKPAPMLDSAIRFGINTTLGVLGLFDVAQSWFRIPRQESHFDDTLARYDIGYGVYLVLPFLGPSDLRHGTSTLVDFQLNPVRYLIEPPERYGLQAIDYVQDLDSQAQRYRLLYQQAEDPYLFFRNLHLQGVQRDAVYEE